MTESTKFIDIRDRFPGSPPGSVVEVRADTRCTRARPGNELSDLEDRDGAPWLFGEPWADEVTTLAACKVGDIVFAALYNPSGKWTICEVMSNPRDHHAGRSNG